MTSDEKVTLKNQDDIFRIMYLGLKEWGVLAGDP